MIFGARPMFLWIVWIGWATTARWRAPVTSLNRADDAKYKVTDDGDMKAREI